MISGLVAVNVFVICYSKLVQKTGKKHTYAYIYRNLYFTDMGSFGRILLTLIKTNPEEREKML